MKKLYPIEQGPQSVAENHADFLFMCPGCNEGHGVWTSPGKKVIWKFDGNLENPTFEPSILITGVHKLTDQELEIIAAGGKVEPRHLVCHSFVRLGKIEFLGDCTHALRGQTVDLPLF